MDENNNNPNLHRGRAIPLNERVGEIFECRSCFGFFAHIQRHEALCQGPVKPYRCPICRVCFTSAKRADRHFREKHPGDPRPRNFLNPHFRHRARQANAAAPPQPPQPPAEAAAAVAPAAAPAAEDMAVDPPPQLQQEIPQVEAAGDVPPPIEVGLVGEGIVPPVVEQQEVGQAAAPAQQLGAGNGGPPQIGVLLGANLAANLGAAREALGSDLLVIQLVAQMLADPEQFRL